MKAKSKTSYRRFVGIILAVVFAALIYLVVANILFSRTYEMVSTSLIARAETKAASLEQEISWPLAANEKQQMLDALNNFRKTNPETIAVLVYKSDGELVQKVGDIDSLKFFKELQGKDITASILRESLLGVGKPILPDFVDKTLGYLIYIRSVASYLKFRKNMMIITVLISAVMILFMAKLMQSQISVSIKNEKLLEGLQAQAEELRNTNDSMKNEIDERIRAEAQLSRYRMHLEDLVEDRTLELMKIRDQLVDASHRASMAETEQSMLHSVGDALTRVNVAAGMMDDMVRESQILKKTHLENMVKYHSDAPPMLPLENNKGENLPSYSGELEGVTSEEGKE